MAGEEGRSFRKGNKLVFRQRTCFVLTDSGSQFATSAVEQARQQSTPPPRHTQIVRNNGTNDSSSSASRLPSRHLPEQKATLGLRVGS